MFTKTLAAAAVAALLLLAAPAAAQAADYPSGSPCTFDAAVVHAGGTATLICQPGTWGASELIDWTATGEDGSNVHLAVLKSDTSTVHFSKHSNADGSDVLKVTLPADASGVYTLLGHGETSDHTCVSSVTVVPVDQPISSSSDPGKGLADTGSVIAGWAVWAGGGLLGLGLIAVAIAAWMRKVRSS